ncbi:hypothetical protein H0H87_008733 [Tephrocybe sp. NHM501043]|nr:hypothetical protein H0H87_008733 [Tephrocybe sp. NHM501043]
MSTGADADADTDITLYNISCRILVLAPRLSEAKSCIDRIQNRDRPQSSTNIIGERSSTLDSNESPTGLIKIPWTIINKYYSAHSHQSYKHHIERIAQDLSGFEPEVCLGVRLASQSSSRPASPTSEEEGVEEDDSDIDAFLSSRGFEYIDATEKKLAHSVEEEDSNSDGWSTDIPGMERVLDALSTIMWPSMQSTIKDAKLLPQTRERERALLDWANTSQDHSLLEVEEVVANSNKQLSDRTRLMKREIQEFARWLEEDDAMRDDPWKSAVSSGGMSMSSTAMDFGDRPAHAMQDNFGFDDDFTVFVSAPAAPVLDSAENSGRSTPDAFTESLSPLSAVPTGSYYHSLGSVSDFGGSEEGRDADGDDDDLPTKEDIKATSSRIFGTPKFPLSPGLETRTSMVKASNASEYGSSVIANSKVSPDEAYATEDFAVNGIGSYDMEPFDLSKVLGTLQEMKAEISTIDDESERRKAAARVALGLVYGLEAESEL